MFHDKPCSTKTAKCHQDKKIKYPFFFQQISTKERVELTSYYISSFSETFQHIRIRYSRCWWRFCTYIMIGKTNIFTLVLPTWDYLTIITKIEIIMLKISVSHNSPRNTSLTSKTRIFQYFIFRAKVMVYFQGAESFFRVSTIQTNWYIPTSNVIVHIMFDDP